MNQRLLIDVLEEIRGIPRERRLELVFREECVELFLRLLSGLLVHITGAGAAGLDGRIRRIEKAHLADRIEERTRQAECDLGRFLVGGDLADRVETGQTFKVGTATLT